MTNEYKQKLAEASIDYESGIIRFSGKEDLYERFLKRFPDDPNYPELLVAIEREDYQQAELRAHTLKGVSANLSMIDLYQAASDVVAFLHEAPKPDEDKLNALIGYVRESYERVLEAVNE